MPENQPVSGHAVECAECGRTSPLTSTGDGTPRGWAYIADKGIILCPLHRPQMPEGWRDVVRIYTKDQLEQRDDIKPPPPGAFDDDE